MKERKTAMDTIVPAILMIEIEIGNLTDVTEIETETEIIEVINIQDTKIQNRVIVHLQNIDIKVDLFLLLLIHILDLPKTIIKVNQNQNLIQAKKKKAHKKIKI